MQPNYSEEELNAVNEASGLVHSKPKEAPSLLDAVISHYQQAGKVVCALESRSWQCFGYLSILEYEKAQSHIEILVAEANSANCPRFLGFAKLYLGIISAETDKSEEALDFLEDALQIAVDLDDRDLIYRIKSSLGYVQIRAEQYEDALDTLNQCFRRVDTRGLPDNNSTIYFNVASATVQLAYREFVDGALTKDRLDEVSVVLEASRQHTKGDSRLVILGNILYTVYKGLSGAPEEGLLELAKLKPVCLSGSETQRKAFMRARCQLLEMAERWEELVSESLDFMSAMERSKQYSALSTIFGFAARGYAGTKNFESAYGFLNRASARTKSIRIGARKERAQVLAMQKDLSQNKFDQDILRMRNKSLIERNKILELEARYDPLSGLLNRRGTEEALQQFTERKFATRFLIALLDIDHFKRINDKFGHAIGDQVIHEFANCLTSSATNPSKVGRWGGEEFLIVYDVHNEEEMDVIGKTLVEEIRGLNWDHIHNGMLVTASVGLSMWCRGDSLDNSVRIADDMLYDVKHHGRDNWRSWPLEEAA